MYPYRPAEPEPLPPPPPSSNRTGRQRSLWLTLWLVASTIFSILALARWLTPTNNPRLTTMLMCAFAIMMLANLICLSAIWSWKRWGVIGVAVITIVSPVLETIARVATPSDYIAPVIQLTILYFLVKDAWDFDFT